MFFSNRLSIHWLSINHDSACTYHSLYIITFSNITEHTLHLYFVNISDLLSLTLRVHNNIKQHNYVLEMTIISSPCRRMWTRLHASQRSKLVKYLALLRCYNTFEINGRAYLFPTKRIIILHKQKKPKQKISLVMSHVFFFLFRKMHLSILLENSTSKKQNETFHLTTYCKIQKLVQASDQTNVVIYETSRTVL